MRLLGKIFVILLGFFILSFSALLSVNFGTNAIGVEPSTGYQATGQSDVPLSYNITYIQTYGYGLTVSINSGFINTSITENSAYILDALNIYKFGNQQNWILTYEINKNVTTSGYIAKLPKFGPGLYKVEFGALLEVNYSSFSNLTRYVNDYYNYLSIYLPKPDLLIVPTGINAVSTIIVGLVYRRSTTFVS